MEWAAGLGVVSGAGNGNFAPDTPVTREQMAVMVYNYIKLMGYELPESETVGFSDTETVSAWTQGAVTYMQTTGLLTGKDGGQFDPQGIASRAEVAEIFARLINKLENETHMKR